MRQLLIGLLIGILLCHTAIALAQVKVGQSPTIHWTDLDEKPVDSASMAGRVIVIHFWADWDPASVKGLDSLAKLKQAHANERLLLIGVNLDLNKSIDELRQIQIDRSIDWPQVADRDGSIARAWDVRKIPVVFILGTDGAVLWTGSPTQLDKPLTDILSKVPAATRPSLASRMGQPRQKIPDAATLARALRMVDNVYTNEIALAATASQKSALAEKLIATAALTENDSSGQFALYSRARDLAIAAVDSANAFDAIDSMADRFIIDRPLQRTDALGKISGIISKPSDRRDLFDAANQVMDICLASDRFDLAKRANVIANTLADQMRDPELAKFSFSRTVEIRYIEALYGKMITAQSLLAANSADPAANAVVGKYTCLIRSNWEQGLPMLAKGNNPDLKSIAEKELAPPADGSAKLELADAWWDLAEKESGPGQRRMQIHAGFWYAQALPDLTGLARARAEKRLNEARVAGPKPPVMREVTYLSELPERDVKVGYGKLGKNGDLGYDDKKAIVQGIPRLHALSAHPPAKGFSHLGYDLSGQYATFSSGIAVVDGLTSITPLLFVVVGDGKELWKSTPIDRPDQAQEINLSIRGVKRLELYIFCKGSFEKAEAVWVDPAVAK